MQLNRQTTLTILLSTRVLMTVPKRRTSFCTSEEPDGVLGTLLITNRLLQPTRTGLSCRMQWNVTYWPENNYSSITGAVMQQSIISSRYTDYSCWLDEYTTSTRRAVRENRLPPRPTGHYSITCKYVPKYSIVTAFCMDYWCP